MKLIAKLVEARRVIIPRVGQLLLWGLAALGACYLISMLLPWDVFPTVTVDSASSSGQVTLGALAIMPQPSKTGASHPAVPGDEAAAGTDAPSFSDTHNEGAALPSPAAPLKKVALTFDDGPDTKYTPQVLEILKQYGVKATFFVVGTQVEKVPEMLKVLRDEGHTIGNHSYGHANLPKLDMAELEEEIRKADQLIADVLGEKPRFFRAPYGAVSDPLRDFLEASGQQLVGWTVDTRDWAGTEPEEILQIVQETTKPDGIILMHSFGGRKGSLQNTVDALPAVIEHLQENGYTFVTLADLYPS